MSIASEVKAFLAASPVDRAALRKAWGDATKATTSYRMWKDNVLTLAGIGVDGAAESITEDRLRLWYDSGEPVWMAADAAKAMSMNSARETRANRDANFLRSQLRKGKRR